MNFSRTDLLVLSTTGDVSLSTDGFTGADFTGDNLMFEIAGATGSTVSFPLKSG